MKKLVFLFVAAVAVSFASCGGNTQQAEAVDTVDTVVVDTTACDSAACDSAACDSVKADSVKA